MNCERCKKPGKQICDSCLPSIVERWTGRALKETREGLFVNDGSFKGAVNEHIAGKITANAKISKKGGKDALFPLSANDTAEGFMQKLLTGKRRRVRKSILKDSTDAELFRYAKIRKLRWKKHKENEKFVDALERELEGSSHSIAKISEKLKDL